MPKMRGFKAEIWTDDKFVELSAFARLLFMGMWSYACDNGHLDDKPKQIKMRVLPTDDVDPVELIDEMVGLGMVDRGDGVLTVRKLREHQRIDDRYFTWCDRCVLDEIPERSREKYVGATQGTRGDSAGAHREPTLKEGRKVKEGEGDGEGDGEGSATGKPAAKRSTQLPDTFRPSDKHVELARELGVDLRAEWLSFVDHHRAKGSTFKDWDAALRNWIRNAKKFSGNVRALTPRASEPDEQGRIILPPLPRGVFEQ